MSKRPTRTRARGGSPELAPLSPKHNDLNDEQKGRLFNSGIDELVKLNERYQTAGSACRLQRKKMKSDGFGRAMVEYALWLRKCEGDEAVTRMQEQIRIAEWLGKPLGFQPTLFEDPPTIEGEATTVQ